MSQPPSPPSRLAEAMPLALEKPITYTLVYRLLPDYEMVEFVCDNNREYIDGEVVHAKFVELKTAQAERCPKALGARVKTSEIQFHHEITNQYLWSQF